MTSHHNFKNHSANLMEMLSVAIHVSLCYKTTNKTLDITELLFIEKHLYNRICIHKLVDFSLSKTEVNPLWGNV